MLTKSYEVGPDGRWRRRLDDFVEDLVVACAECGVEPGGRFEADDGSFAFTPDPRRADGGDGPAGSMTRNGPEPDR